jgi:hypothetical protein
MRLPTLIAAGVIAGGLVCNDLWAAYTWYPEDFSGWQQATGPYTTIGFNDLPFLTVVTDQYADLGVFVTSPFATLADYGPGVYAEDDWGLNPQGTLEFTFSTPMYAVGGHVPGSPLIQLLMGNTVVGLTPPAFGTGPKFTGLTSDVPFDRVRFIPAIQNGIAQLDNLYFSTVPAPGCAGVILFVAVKRRRRR